MTTRTTSIRRANGDDVEALSAVFDAAWREAYRGVIPGVALERMIAQRSERWWQGTLRRGRPVAVVETGERVAGYATYGRCRSSLMRAEGEVDEIYLLPEYQGLGLGRRLFRAVHNDLRDHKLGRIGVWSLADNERACAFYEALGGRRGPETIDRLAGVPLSKAAYLFG